MHHFALLGHPVSHSLSPKMHAANFSALGMEAEYVAFDVATEDAVAPFLRTLRDDGCAGANVTVPHKHAAYDAMDSLAPSARKLGVVNTVVFENGTMIGHNTDGIGFLRDLDDQFHITPLGLRCLVIGCGGAGRAIAITLADAGATQLHLTNRTMSKAETLAEELTSLAPSTQTSVIPWMFEPSEDISLGGRASPQAGMPNHHYDLVINCASPLTTPPAPNFLLKAPFFYDLNYGSREQRSLRALLEKSNARCADGLGLLVQQGAESFRLWTHREPNLIAMRDAIF